ncbi:MAG: glycosyltransferase family 4 protein [Chryseolinea sp.]
MENKVLIIAYYWPPSGGSGVQRWLKFVKYLPSLGWKPYVFTPENPAFAVQDQSLLKDVPTEAEVIRFPIWEPYEAFFKLSSLFGNKKSAKPTDLVSGKKKSLFQNVSTWVRGNFFIPDPRVFWIRPSVKFLSDFIRDNQINTIITTGPPHSMHLIGLKLKKKNPSIKWLADFRDPWSEWGLLDSLMVGSIARKLHRRLESDVLDNADHIITITPFYVKQFARLAEKPITLLTNGYDEDDFKHMVIKRTDKFVIRHAGIINEKCDPKPFLVALEEVMNHHPDFKNDVHLDFVGDVHPQVKEFIGQSSVLSSAITFTKSVPHHDLITLYGESALLLIILTGYKDAEGYMPGKLFEYLATGLPILGTGPSNGDAAVLLNESKAGEMIEGNDKEKIKQALLNAYENWKNSKSVTAQLLGFKKYSRKSITKELTSYL